MNTVFVLSFLYFIVKVSAYTCNSCPKTLAVHSGSKNISQYPGVNQWNCSDVVLRCANSIGGSVTLKFYENGFQVTSVHGNGTVYETVNCSTENYQWVYINGKGIKVNAVSCSNP